MADLPGTLTGMPHSGNSTLDMVLYVVAGLALLVLGYRVGRMMGRLSAEKLIQAKEQDLFTAQKSFKQLYEGEVNNLKAEVAQLQDQVRAQTARVDEYRKKAAGFGGLFNSAGKRADAMYALLLENEALEDALYAQNEKLRQERTDALKEQMRSAGYRRVLMSQLLNDERIKGYVAEILADEKRLPAPGDASQPMNALPGGSTAPNSANP